jgi:hypothetical protein
MRAHPFRAKLSPMVVVTERLPEAPARAEVDELERIWEAPARKPSRRRSARLRPIAWFVPIAWIAALVSLSVLEPTPHDLQIPGWVDALSTIFFLVLAASAFAALVRRAPIALAGSLGAAGIGVVLAWSCRSTAHHLGSWWLVELAVFSGLAALSASALLSRRQR